MPNPSEYWSSWQALMHFGMQPASALLEKNSMCCKPVSFPSSGGIVPVSAFLDKSMVRNFVNAASPGGIVPVSAKRRQDKVVADAGSKSV